MPSCRCGAYRRRPMPLCITWCFSAASIDCTPSWTIRDGRPSAPIAQPDQACRTVTSNRLRAYLDVAEGEVRRVEVSWASSQRTGAFAFLDSSAQLAAMDPIERSGRRRGGLQRHRSLQSSTVSRTARLQTVVSFRCREPLTGDASGLSGPTCRPRSSIAQPRRPKAAPIPATRRASGPSSCRCGRRRCPSARRSGAGRVCALRLRFDLVLIVRLFRSPIAASAMLTGGTRIATNLAGVMSFSLCAAGSRSRPPELD